MQTVLEFTEQLALSTGEILLGYYSPLGITSERKEDNTVVTEADFAADKYITETIQQTYPDDVILSEEGNTQLDKIDQAIWIIDPLDGTTNFSLGVPIWGISIARVVNGIPEVGVLNFPAVNELYSAQKDAGASLNGKKLQARENKAPRTPAFFTCCTRTHRRYNVNIPYKTRILGSAAYNLVSVARSTSVIAFESNPKIWDIAASWLIVEESGGLNGVLSGPTPFPLTAGTDYAAIAYPTYMSVSESMKSQAIEGIRPIQ